MEVIKMRLFFFFSFAGLMCANCVELDNFWKALKDQAANNTVAAYEANPGKITNTLNFHVNRVLAEAAMESNVTRRNLSGKKRNANGQCMAVNPIDKCWRCRENWESNRERLADCVLGFGHKTQGGKGGKIYVVTDSSDNSMLNPKPGTLRHAVIQKEPLWIIFAHDMTIRLSQELIVQSKKTIDGRGANVHIANGAGITIQFVDNVIIHGLHIHDIVSGSGGMIRDSVDHYGKRGKSDGDGISIFGSTNIWLDHVSMSNCQDGLIDAIQGSTAITISNCHFTHHDHVILLGASDSYSLDKMMQVTVAFNHFGKGLIQRMPRCRWGFFHVVNNDYTHWKMYAIGGSEHPIIISQGNRFVAPDDIRAKEVTKRDGAPESEWMKWLWMSQGDLLLNGAIFRTSGPSEAPHMAFKGWQMVQARLGTAVGDLTQDAGALGCRKGIKC